MALPRPRPDKLNLRFIKLGIDVEAYYNPKEIGVDKQAPWTEHHATKTEGPRLEFTGSSARTLSLELFFDTYETGDNVYKRYIERLELGTTIMEAQAEKDKHPPACLISWGRGFPKFLGVIESLSVKYTMFFRDGTPCRATATVKLKEVPRVRMANGQLGFALEAKEREDGDRRRR